MAGGRDAQIGRLFFRETLHATSLRFIIFSMNLIEQHAAQFEKLWTLFSDWNSKINLSAIREKEAVYEKHFQDSLLLTDFFDIKDLNILDIGSGGGFPVLPLAIVTPSSSFTALDSVGKKMKVVADIATQLELKNVKTLHGRFEEFGKNPHHREKYDIVVARAVAPWPVILEYALPFVKVGGSFIAYQGPSVEEHLGSGIEELLGGEIERVEETTLGENERVFVEIKKVEKCSKAYPRMNGVPRQEPLQGNEKF